MISTPFCVGRIALDRVAGDAADHRAEDGGDRRAVAAADRRAGDAADDRAGARADTALAAVDRDRANRQHGRVVDVRHALRLVHRDDIGIRGRARTEGKRD
jgi:hypothetical protein